MFAQKKGSGYQIKIYEMGSDNRYVDFSIARWASFVRAINEAQNAIHEIHTNPQLKFEHHIAGATLYVIFKDFYSIKFEKRLSIVFVKFIGLGFFLSID